MWREACMPCKSAGRQSWPGRQRGPNQASQAEASMPSQLHCWQQPMHALAFRKFGARATVKLPLPQYSSSRSPPVLPAARKGKRRAAKRSQVSQSVQVAHRAGLHDSNGSSGRAQARRSRCCPPVAPRAQLSMFWHMPPFGWLKDASTCTCLICCPSTVSTSSTSSASKHSFWPLQSSAVQRPSWTHNPSRQARPSQPAVPLWAHTDMHTHHGALT